PDLVSRGLAVAHSFEGSCVKTTPEAEAYWRDVGTIDAYWAANIDLVMPTPSLDIYDPNWPIWTYQEQLPPAKFVFDDDDRRGMAVDSMIAGGSIVSGSKVRHSLLVSNVHVHSFCEIEDSVIFPDVDIARNCRIRRTILDRGCRVPEGSRIGFDLKEDRKRFHVTERDVVLVTPEMLGQDFHHAI